MSITDFDLSSMITTFNKNVSILIVGRDDEEKRRMILNIMEKNDIRIGMIIGKEKSFYEAFFPNCAYFDEYHNDIIGNYNIRPNKCIHTSYVIIDNMFHDIQLTNIDGEYFKFMQTFRLQNTCPIICTSHEPINLIPQVLYSFDYVFILPEFRNDIRFQLYMTYANIFPTFAQFNDIMDELCKDHKSMIIDYKHRFININKKVYKLGTHDVRIL